MLSSVHHISSLVAHPERLHNAHVSPIKAHFSLISAHLPLLGLLVGYDGQTYVHVGQQWEALEVWQLHGLGEDDLCRTQLVFDDTLETLGYDQLQVLLLEQEGV